MIDHKFSGDLQNSTLSFTFRANFSLLQIITIWFSLLVWISHFSCADARISHFKVWISRFPARTHEFLTFWFEFLTFGHFSREILTFPSNFSLFQPATLARRPALFVSPASPLPRRPSQWHTWLIPCYGWAGARRQITVRPACLQKVRNSECRRAKSEKLTEKWEIGARTLAKWEIQTPKVRNWRTRAGKVRNWRMPGNNVRNSN